MSNILDSTLVPLLAGLAAGAALTLLAWAALIGVRRGLERLVMWIQVRRFAWWRR